MAGGDGMPAGVAAALTTHDASPVAVTCAGPAEGPAHQRRTDRTHPDRREAHRGGRVREPGDRSAAAGAPRRSARNDSCASVRLVMGTHTLACVMASALY